MNKSTTHQQRMQQIWGSQISTEIQWCNKTINLV